MSLLGQDTHSHGVFGFGYFRLGQFVPLESCLVESGGQRATAAAAATAATAPRPIDPAVKAAAEKVKGEGNTLMAAGDIEGAIAK